MSSFTLKWNAQVESKLPQALQLVHRFKFTFSSIDLAQFFDWNNDVTDIYQNKHVKFVSCNFENTLTLKSLDETELLQGSI